MVKAHEFSGPSALVNDESMKVVIRAQAYSAGGADHHAVFPCSHLEGPSNTFPR